MALGAICALAVACSDPAGDDADTASPEPRPITTADTGGFDLALTDVVYEWGPPTPVTWFDGPGRPSGRQTMTQFGTVGMKILNATDSDVVNPYITCVFDNGDNDSSGSAPVNGTVPAHGELIVSQLNVGGGSGPGKDITCGVAATFDRESLRQRGPVLPLPGSVVARQVQAPTPTP